MKITVLALEPKGGFRTAYGLTTKRSNLLLEIDGVSPRVDR